MSTHDEFEAIRNDPDPIRRGLRAGELIGIYKQRSVELARLRKAAIEQANQDLGLSFSEIGERLGLTKGRISQIRTSAPPPERAYFGVGPVAIGVPRRIGIEEGRERAYIDTNDEATRSILQALMDKYALATTDFAIHPDTEEAPAGDCVIVCGPKSAPVARNLLAHDPLLTFDRSEDGWAIVDLHTGDRHTSPFRTNGTRKDIGYLSRRIADDRVIVHIAGITAIGSEGVAHWLKNNLATVYDPGARLTDCVIECEFDAKLVVTGSRLLAGPESVAL
ncbi:nitrogen fixation protein NifE [Nocardia sp. MH4]|uniref:sigma-70 family RNA polymerase sigma factor n=1 Tax=Nocardia sp. MH4 TaxID=1768677 RepID=UPI001C4E5ACF|nr:sigma-70 family RNA polymerase sigma factor [Nocardia sp. MH4]MBW0274380.1 nitrogen fixation protein NifE [Nocardia sp. MH4]